MIPSNADANQRCIFGTFPKGWSQDRLRDRLTAIVGGEWGDAPDAHDEGVEILVIRVADIRGLTVIQAHLTSLHTFVNKPFHEIPEADRPREKLLRKGAKALSDQELLAVLLGKGTSTMDVMTLAGKLARLIDEKGLEVTAGDLSQFDGVGDAKATLILAAIEFARRRIKPEGSKIETPADMLPHIRHYADRKQEHFLCATINGANEILNIRVVSIGLIDRSPVHPREVFADALTDRASAIVVAHNHPSGGLEPSHSDIQITAQLKAAGEIVGIELLDHIIFNRTDYFSFLEDGRL